MIDAVKDTPIEYSKQSRDYQVLALIYTILFNQPKMFVDLLKQVWTDNIDNKLLDLRAYTLNFIPKYSWENTDLRGVTNSFRYLLRTKGTKGAIIGCLEILARIKGIPLTGTSVELLDNGVVQLIISDEIDDVGNIEDLLRYILPAGTVYEIVKYSRVDSSQNERIVVDSITSEGGIFKTKDLFLPNSEGDSKGWYLPTTDGKYFNSPNSTMDYFTAMMVSDSSEGDNPFTPNDY